MAAVARRASFRRLKPFCHLLQRKNFASFWISHKTRRRIIRKLLAFRDPAVHAYYYVATTLHCFFQYHHNLIPKAVDFPFFPCRLSIHNYNTWLASYYIDHFETTYSKLNLHFSGPSIWSNLDEDLKRLSLLSFEPNLWKKQFLSPCA